MPAIVRKNQQGYEKSGLEYQPRGNSVTWVISTAIVSTNMLHY